MRKDLYHKYRIFGLPIQSELELPELVPIDNSIATDVAIRILPTQSKPNSVFELKRAGDTVSLRVPGVGIYKIAGGKTITVAPDLDASHRDLRLFLLGSAFAAILHQRGLLPLHSNAIEIDGKAVAFLGPSGAGKSTLAAWFHDCGHAVLSDDVCVVSVDEHGAGVVHGGVPRLRLWRDALEASGRIADDQERAAERLEKYNVRTEHSASHPEVALSHIYLLGGHAGPDADHMVTRLTGSRAVQALVENTYRGSYVKLLGETKRHFEQCVSLAQNLAIFEVQRPWDLDALDQVGIALEDHARSFIKSQWLLNAD